MADLTITVSDRDEPDYSPEGSTAPHPTRGLIRQGGTVEFKLAIGSDPVTVTFPNGSPFALTGPILLGGISQQTQQDKTVAFQTVPANYKYVVTPQNPPPPHPGKDPEPPTTVSGDLEVTPGFTPA
ncbi:hypothetical protein POL68_24495 [Stigmatella sp. ncwal1]|uniref:Uncharacterized protein n=1 Tax=Stigmatella ashevillensis TaxID=2995309 RepID=A0ABT5DDS3_9BACT|nr:hypothetical protein [Stigmatella ashevillena]MDC0711651.1 hypothetical protein [Stigmatella ashevillena]